MWEDPGRDTRRRLSVAEASDALGITVDAVRSRVKRGTIDHVRVGRRVYVLLGDDESRPGRDQDTDQGGDQGTTTPEDRTAELIATLREQLQAERQAHAEARRIIAGLVERIPAIEAPQEARGSPETATVDEKGAKTLEVRAPSHPQLTPILGTLSAAVVGSIPWLQDVLEVNLNLSPPVTNVPLALFVLPFIFGLYRGVWNIRVQEFQEQAPRPTPAQQDGEAIGEEAVEPLRWGTREVIVALLTAAGAALVAFVETLLRILVIQAVWVPRNVFAIIWVFIFTFLFYIFASLIGAATGGQRSGRDATPSETWRGSLSSSAWWNPQLFLSLLGTIITAIATVYAATVGG